MDLEKFIRVKGKCCISGKPMLGTEINVVSLPYKATWPFPSVANILTGTLHMAVAIVHDDCIIDGGLTDDIKFAIEFFGDDIIYHPVSELKLYKAIIVRKCRVCGCTCNDACYHPQHGVCHWADVDLCSHCQDYPGESFRYSEMAAKSFFADRIAKLSEN